MKYLAESLNNCKYSILGDIKTVFRLTAVTCKKKEIKVVVLL